MKRRRFWLVLAIVCAAAQIGFHPLSAVAQQPPLTEYQLKALFIFNFPKFVEWPADAFATTNDPFVIGVIGENPFGTALEDTVKDKSMNEHPFVVKRVRTPAEARKCHILFVSDSDRKRVSELLNALKDASVLTVSDLDHFLELGGMIRFYMEGKRVRFEINHETAKTCRLKISSSLLQLGPRAPKEDAK